MKLIRRWVRRLHEWLCPKHLYTRVMFPLKVPHVSIPIWRCARCGKFGSRLDLSADAS